MRKIFTLIFSLLLFSTSAIRPVLADSYSIGFETSHIKILSPHSKSINCSGSLSIDGTSDLSEVWFCVRSPQKELTTARAQVVDGRFNLDLNLRMGAGEYTIWAGDNPTRFDGSIRFLVKNESSEDARYTAPSLYVNYKDPDISRLAESLTAGETDDMSKLKKIHDWITRNISYDYEAYARGENKLITASETLAVRKGMCRDYAFLLAALSRSAGLPAKVVYGEASPRAGLSKGLHAWNEVMVNGQWVPVDSCWDAGYITSSEFVSAPSTRFLAPDRAVLAATHTATSAALY